MLRTGVRGMRTYVSVLTSSIVFLFLSGKAKRSVGENGRATGIGWKNAKEGVYKRRQGKILAVACIWGSRFNLDPRGTRNSPRPEDTTPPSILFPLVFPETLL